MKERGNDQRSASWRYTQRFLPYIVFTRIESMRCKSLLAILSTRN